MIAIVINGLAASLGAALGCLLHRGIPERVTKALFSAIALCVIVMAVQGAVKTENLLLLLASIASGVLCGTLGGIEQAMERGAAWLKRHVHATGDDSFVNALVTLSVMQLAGAMAIIGPLQSALSGNTDLLYFKSLLDGISAFIFGTIYGLGTVPIGLVVIVYEGFFFFIAAFMSPLMTADVIRELNAVGSVMVLAIGLNMLGLTKLKVGDYIPGLCVPIIYYQLLTWWG